MRTIYCVAILLVLAGCTSQEQIGSRQAAPQAAKQAAVSRGQIAESHPAQEVALNRADDVRCRQSRGAPGSNAYLACRVNLASNRPAHDGQAAANR
jgi:hypothetical protein